MNLTELLKRSVYHTYIAQKGEVNSTVYVNVPIWGELEHMWKLERSVEVPKGNYYQGDAEWSTSVLEKEILYVIVGGTEISEPVKAGDGQDERIIGKMCYLLDRGRLTDPILKEKDGSFYLDCVKRGE